MYVLSVVQKKSMSTVIQKPRFAFFGTPEFATIILDELEKAGFLPALVITGPDKAKGRKLVITPSEVKEWACTRSIPLLTPERIRGDEAFALALKKADCDLFVVAAYGKIIPKEILDISKHGTLNVHPSLLPKFRGSSPVESAILSNETGTGVTIMLLDEELDHGPIVATRVYASQNWPPKGSELTQALAHEGGKLLAEVIPDWVHGLLFPAPQKHDDATFTKKITKEDGLIDLSGDPLLNYKKIRAYDGWPGAYFFIEHGGKKIRVRITEAHLEGSNLILDRVTPEGKKEMPYEDFLRGVRH